jgi:hypothetical protein
VIKKVLFVVALTIQFAAATEAPSVKVLMPDCYPCDGGAAVTKVLMPDCYPCDGGAAVTKVLMPDCYPCDVN